jgi:hypothetical protein
MRQDSGDCQCISSYFSCTLDSWFCFYILAPVCLAADASLYFWCVTVALTMARARISSLETKLRASMEAWESANAAKVSAEKATVSGASCPVGNPKRKVW